MLLSTFVALGRIFDKKLPHNINALMSAVSASLQEFSMAALKARRISNGFSEQETAIYASHMHALTADDVKKLRGEIKRWRCIYEDRYSDIRNRVFAHNELTDFGDINALFAKTNVIELKELFNFLSALGLALWAAYHNGVAVNLDSYDMEMSVGELVRREAEAVLRSMLDLN